MNEHTAKRIAQRYDLLAMIGRGGMGAVYRARDLKADRNVALKLIRPEFSSDPKTRRRFNKEARAFAFLKHPNIVEVYDFGQDEDGTLFLAMELVRGVSLRVLKSLDIPLSAIFSIIDQLLAALAHAHARGVIHRDLKPENVLVTQPFLPDDTSPLVKLVDFGLAALPTQQGLSQTGTLLGTPAYMAPEQARGAKGVVGPGTDIYAVGVLLYEILCDRLPYSGDGGVETLLKHVQEPIPSLEPRAGLELPEALEEVVHRAMAKKPWDRFINAAEFRRAFGAIAVPEESMPVLELEDESDSSHPTPVSSHKSRHPTPVSSIAIEPIPTPTHGTPSFDQNTAPAPSQPAENTTPQPAHTDSSPVRKHISRDAIAAVASQVENIPTPTGGSVVSAVAGLTPTHSLIGRKLETLRLEECFDRALAGQGQIVVLDGEAGIGKSQLARSVLTRYTETGLMREAVGLYSSTESSGPNVGLRGALESLFGTTDMDRSSMQAQTFGVLERVGISDPYDQNELVNLLRPTEEAHATPGLIGGRDALLRKQRSQLALIQRVVRLIAQEMPLILLLEEIHWSRDGLASFLDSIANSFRLHATSCIVIITLVGDEIDPLSSLAEGLGHLSRYEGSVVHRIQLGRLSNDEILDLIQATLPLEPELAQHLAVRSGGNPLYAIQFLQALKQEKTLHLDKDTQTWGLPPDTELDSALPASISDVLKRRIQRTRATLGDKADDYYQLLTRIAILGLSCDVQLLESLLHRENNATLLACLDNAIELWLQHSILRESTVDRHADIIEFDHPLIRDVLLDGLPNRKLRKLHKLAANAKRDFFYPYLQPVAADIAEHFQSAGDVAQASEYLLLAARSDEAAGAFRQAAKHYSTLLSFRRGPSDSTEFHTPSGFRVKGSSGLLRLPTDISIDWSEVWLGLGRIAVSQGNYDKATLYVEELVQYAQERELLLPQAKANWLLGRIANRRGQLVEAWDHFGMARDLYEAEQDMVGTAQCLWGLGQVARASGWLTEARKYIHEASAIYEEAERPVDVAGCLLALGMTELAAGLLASAREQFERAQATFAAAQDNYNVNYCLLGIAHAERESGNTHEALRLLEQAHNAFVELGDIHGQTDCLLGIGQCYTRLGQLDEAEKHLAEALTGYEQLSDSRGLGNNLLAQAELCRWRDAKTQAIQYLSQAQEHLLIIGDRRGQASSYLHLARIALDLQDVERAESHFNPAHELYTISEDAIGIAECAELWARICAARNETAEALGAINDGLEVASRTGAVPIQAQLLGAAMLIAANSNQHTHLRAYAEQFDALELAPHAIHDPSFITALEQLINTLQVTGLDPELRRLRENLANLFARLQ